MKQSPKTGHKTVDTFLVGIGFKALKTDSCFYIFNETTAVKLGFAMDDDSMAILAFYESGVLLEGGN